MLQALPRVHLALLALVAAAIAVVVGPTAPAEAHAELISSTPADGVTLAAPPAVVRLTFSDPIAAEFVRTAVTTPAGTATVKSGATGPTVTVPVPAGGPGSYRVVYRVVSADGHPVSGQIRFTVTGDPTAGATPASTPASTAASTPAETTPAATPVAAGAPTSGAAGPPWLLIVAIGAAVAAGVGAVVAAVRGGRS